MSTIYIPKKIKVGYQNRNDTYTKKLAYVIYYDEKGKLRKETSWQNWRDKKIEPDDFDNEPTRGFVLNKKVGDYAGGWGEHRQAYCRIYDPRGFEFEIIINNLLFILEHCDCLKGKGLDGDFVYGWDGKDLVLIPVDSPDYMAIKTHTDKIQNGKKFKGKDLIIGATYLTKNKEQWVYMGRFDKWDVYDRYKGINENKGKYYWFCTTKNKSGYRKFMFVLRKSVGSILIDCLDEKPSQKYHEYFEDLEHNHFAYNPIEWDSEVILDLPYDKFIKKIDKAYNWMCFYDKNYSYTNVYKGDNGLLTYKEKQYLPSELYEVIKPKYKMYKLMNGKEFHNYFNNYLTYYEF